MAFRSLQRRCSLAVLAVLALGAGCHHDTTGPSTNPPASIEAASAQSRTAQVGTPVTDPVVVRVRDAGGRVVIGANVTFAVTAGSGTVSVRTATTDASGEARTVWTLGNATGANELTVAVDGVATQVKFTATATAGPAVTVRVSPSSARVLSGSDSFLQKYVPDSVRLTVTSLDALGNATGSGVSFAARDATLLTVSATGVVRALRGGASTYVIVTAGNAKDSVLITALKPGDSVCSGIATPTPLAVGQVITGLSGTLCVQSSGTATEEYAVVPWFNSTVPGATSTVETRGQGIVNLAVSAAVTASQNGASALLPNTAFEMGLRQREQAVVSAQAGAARDWYTRRGAQRAAARTAVVTTPAVGDLMRFNANSFDPCGNPSYRTGRVVAVTSKAIVIADTANPGGGFTDAAYRGFGVTFDTLMSVVDENAFGQPADIDNNGHVILFFTRAVNELSPRGSNGLTLGYFYGRDLLPTSTCPGSNVGEMFYLLVPDPDSVVGVPLTVEATTAYTNGTIAHEYQHLINGSRRLYINPGAAPTEEVWLNEGLSHIAEELNFWRAAGISPRSDVDTTAFSDNAVLPRCSTASGRYVPAGATRQFAAFQTFGCLNFTRYKEYLISPELRSPIGPNGNDFGVRGAVWSFLRYAVDRTAATNENKFWFQIENGTGTGIANLANALGSDPAPLLRDWALSIYVDDRVGVTDRFQQPSWNTRNFMAWLYPSKPDPLFTRTLIDGSTTVLNLTADGVAFLRFTVQPGRDALFSLTSSQQPLPSAVQVSVVRVK